MSKIFEALRRTQSPIQRLLDFEDADQGDPAEQENTVAAEVRGKSRVEMARAFDIQTVKAQLTANSPIMPFDGTAPRASAEYRMIRTKIHQDPRQPRILVVSSPMPGDGKTISAVNLSAALALQEQTEVLLVDADLNRWSVAKLLGIRSTPGLADVLQGKASLDEALVRVEQLPSFYVLPAGKSDANSAELLASARWKALCELFRKQFRYTVLDGPPVGAIADYELLQISADGVVLVVRPDHTNRHLCQAAFQTVPTSKQIGVILNCTEEWPFSKVQSYYYYEDQSLTAFKK